MNKILVFKHEASGRYFEDESVYEKFTKEYEEKRAARNAKVKAANVFVKKINSPFYAKTVEELVQLLIENYNEIYNKKESIPNFTHAISNNNLIITRGDGNIFSGNLFYYTHPISANPIYLPGKLDYGYRSITIPLSELYVIGATERKKSLLKAEKKELITKRKMRKDVFLENSPVAQVYFQRKIHVEEEHKVRVGDAKFLYTQKTDESRRAANVELHDIDSKLAQLVEKEIGEEISKIDEEITEINLKIQNL